MTDDNGPWKLCLIVLNHILWSAQPIAARYLQVYATPLLFDGQGVLATAKFTSAVLVFSSSRIFASVEDSKDSQPLPHDNITQQQQQSLRRTKYLFALLYGTVATCRAALNIESTKFTQSYFTTTINSLNPIVISIADSLLLGARLPKSLWPAVFGSFAGCAIIGYSQSSLYLKEEESASSFFQDDMLGCILQFASMLFSVAARLLMKRTEGILSRDEAVQTNNFCNTLFPLLYTLLVNPSGWKAFVCMTLESFCAWLTIAVLVYTIASASQMSLVRSVGPGVYSSFSAIRVVVSAWLSAIVLHEPVQDGLEWLGLMVIVITISVYTAMTLVESRRTNEKLPNISRDQAVGTGESLDIEMSRLLQPVK